MTTLPDSTVLIDQLSAILTHTGRRLATAESCTGGLIAAACIDKAGRSDWFNGGIVSYSNEMKMNLLRVPQESIAAHGAVSEAVVRHMAAGALGVCDAQAAIAVSGVAGPSGGTVEKPVGTVWIAVARVDKGAGGYAPGGAIIRAKCRRFSGDRRAVRLASARAALEDMLALLEER